MNLKARLRRIIDPTQEIVRVLVVGICMGVLDIDTRGIYLVDMVGERRGRVVLVVLYCSPGRAQVFSRFRWCAHDAH